MRAMQKISFRNDILPLKDKLFRLALCITRNREEAEDIVQDTMLRVWNRREEWNVWETVEGFCLTICRNLAIDRRQKMDARHVELTPEVTELPDMAAPDKLMERDERLGLLHRLIAELPEKQRTILQLRDVEGKSYKEIAEILHIKEHSSTSQLHRAKCLLIKRIKEYTEYERK